VVSLSYALLNAAGQPATLKFGATGVSYTLRITNTGTRPLEIVAGAPCDERRAAAGSDGATRWYLPVPFAIPESTVEKLAFSAAAWTANAYRFRGRTEWGFTPAGNETLPPSGTIDFTVNGLVVPAQPQLPALNLTATWYAGFPAVSSEVSFSVPIAPDASTNSFTASIESPTNVVYVSSPGEAYANTVMVALQNGPTPLPPGSNSAVTIELPITAVQASNTGAITTAAHAGPSQIMCAIDSAQGTQWMIDPAVPVTPGNVAWQLTPKSNPALPAGGTLLVSLDGIVSPLPSGATTVRVESANFPGFTDTVTDCTAVLEQLPPASFSRAAVKGTQPVAYDTPLIIEWTSACSTSISLAYDDGISSYTLTTAEDGLPLSGSKTLKNTTVDAKIVLTASNVLNGATPETVSVHVTGVPSPSLSVGIVAPAAWDFSAGPAAMTYSIASAPVRLLTALIVTTPSGQPESLMGKTSYSVSQASATPLAFTAEFGTGVGRAPATILVVSPTVESLASFVIGTKWRWNTKWPWKSKVPGPVEIFTFTNGSNVHVTTPIVPSECAYTVGNNTIVIYPGPGRDIFGNPINTAVPWHTLQWRPPVMFMVETGDTLHQVH